MNILTIHLITPRFRAAFPVLGDRTFAVVEHHQDGAATVHATDENIPYAVPPQDWARNLALQLGLRYEPADAHTVFICGPAAGWQAFDDRVCFDCGEIGHPGCGRSQVAAEPPWWPLVIRAGVPA